MKFVVLDIDKFTENKVRYLCRECKVPFEFYVPKRSLPNPPPPRISIRIGTDAETLKAASADIKCLVRRRYDCTKTVRYSPVGDPWTWPIGEPYVPSFLLAAEPPEVLSILVYFDWRKGQARAS